ncbi:unnamed protein product [Aphanomyces euteiches]
MTDQVPYTLTEGSFQSERKIEIYTRKYIPTGAYNTVYVFLHGVGEHCSRFHTYFDILARQNFAVYALDHQGHGKSGGAKFDCHSLNEYIDDIAAFAKIARADHASSPSTRFFLSGISLGGLLAALTAATYPTEWDGLVLFAPAIGIEMSTTLKIQNAFAGIFGAVAPTWTIVPAVVPSLLSRNTEFTEDYIADPLNNHENLRVRLAINISKGMKHLETIQDKIEMPIVIYHGDHDKVTSPRISKAFFEALKSQDKEYKSLSGQFHCLLNEPERESTISSVIEWVQARSKVN